MARNFGRRRSSAKGETTGAAEIEHGSACPHAPCAYGEPGSTSPARRQRSSTPRCPAALLAHGQSKLPTRVDMYR